VAIAAAIGWWLFSTPDAASSAANTGSKARHLVRIAVIIMVASSIGAAIGVAFVGSPQPVPGALSAASLSAMIGFGFIAFVGWIVLYFASLVYIQWLAARLPDAQKRRTIGDFARMLMWLGPLVAVVGACIFIGPYVATILILILLFRLRNALQDVRDEQFAKGYEVPAQV